MAEKFSLHFLKKKGGGMNSSAPLFYKAGVGVVKRYA